MAMCNVYKLFRDGKQFTKESMKLIRSNIVIPRSYVAIKNAKWKENGLWHVIDEKATAEYYKHGEVKRAKKRAAEKVKSQLKDVLTDVLTVGSEKISADTTSVKKEEKIEEKESVENTELVETQELYKKVVGKRLVGKYAKDIPWMKKKIDEHKAK